MNNKIFIGSRKLSEEQVRLILPTFDLIVNQIEDIRSTANNIKKDQNTDTREYNNTISVLGKRGTGKTSIIYTLIDKLNHNDNNSKNIILPIIEPDNISDTTTVMGVILGAFKNRVEEVGKAIQETSQANKEKLNDYFYEYMYKSDSNPLIKKFNNMLEAYCYMDPNNRVVLTKNFTTLENYKKKYQSILSPDIQFKKEFISFIDELIKVYDILLKVSKDETSMIFIIIDDADLKQKKCKEIVEAIMKYICHSNVICILSGDFDILNEAVTLSLIDKELLNRDLISDNTLFHSNLSIKERKKYLAGEYLKKILPPSLRHNVIEWDLNNIYKFSFQIEDDEINKKLELHELLDKLLEKEKNIFKYYIDFDSDEYIIPNLPYCIFDNTPRGLMNVFYALNNIKDKSNFDEVKALIDTIIESSSFMYKYKRDFYDKYLIWGKSFRNSKLDYKKLYSDFVIIYENFKEGIINEKNKSYIVMFMILELLKNINEEVYYEKNYYDDAKYLLLKLLSLNKVNYDLIFNEEDFRNEDGFKNENIKKKKSIKECGIFGELFEVMPLNFNFVLIQKLNEIDGFEYNLPSYSISEKNKFKIFNILCGLMGISEKSDRNKKSNVLMKLEDARNSGKCNRVMHFIDDYIVETQINSRVKICFDDFDNAIENSSISKFFQIEKENVRRLLINTVSYLLCEGRKDIKNYINDYYKKYIKVVDNILSIDHEEFEYKEKVLRYIEKIEKKLDLDWFFIQMIEYNFSNENGIKSIYIDNLYPVIDKFENGNDGVSATKYSDLKNTLKNLIGTERVQSFNYEDYRKIISDLSVFINSTAYYGKNESIKLKDEILKNSKINSNQFEDYIDKEKLISDFKIKNKGVDVEDIINNFVTVIGLKYSLDLKFNPELSKINKIDAKKKKYRLIQENSFEEVKKEEINILEIIGLNLDDIE